ncbi:MAG TPA: hypothetical protein VIK86_07855 [Candidatus Paceibacterota bacterium]
MSIAALNLDKNTLEFAIEIAHNYEFLCKKTKEGRIQIEAFSRVQKTLQHYLQNIDSVE